MVPNNLYEIVQESASAFRSKGVSSIDITIILGSGMSGIVNQFNKVTEFNYTDIPHFVSPGVQEHKGKVILATSGEKSILFFVGRVHYYEGYDMWQVSLPVRVARALGARQLIVTGAAGGLNINYNEGDVVLLEDHINLQPENPLRGINDPRLGLRFPDMSEPYSSEMRKEVAQLAIEHGIEAKTGVYASLPGPSLETKAEYQYLHRIGADLVGMSIVPEVIVGIQCGMQISGICIVSNVCYPPENVRITTIESVLEVVQRSAADVGRLIQAYLLG